MFLKFLYLKNFQRLENLQVVVHRNNQQLLTESDHTIEPEISESEVKKSEDEKIRQKKEEDEMKSALKNLVNLHANQRKTKELVGELSGIKDGLKLTKNKLYIYHFLFTMLNA